jgi:hypothetical protein
MFYPESNDQEGFEVLSWKETTALSKFLVSEF